MRLNTSEEARGVESISSRVRCSLTSHLKPRPEGSSGARHSEHHRPGLAQGVAAVREDLLPSRTSLDPTREPAARSSAPGAVHRSERPSPDGRAELRPACQFWTRRFVGAAGEVASMVVWLPATMVRRLPIGRENVPSPSATLEFTTKVPVNTLPGRVPERTTRVVVPSLSVKVRGLGSRLTGLAVVRVTVTLPAAVGDGSLSV